MAIVGCCVALGLALTASPASAGHGDDPQSLQGEERDNNDQSGQRIHMAQAGTVACTWGKKRLDNTE